jgi:peptidoglycan/LPS O-acetylase OafA/YrhL
MGAGQSKSVYIADRIRETKGHANGFDYLRLSLAMAIVLVHSTGASYGLMADLAIWRGAQSLFPHMILPMFFALSGFLVAGSLERCQTLVSFFGLRILRISPALAVEVTLSAILFGPMLTSLGLSAYFTDPRFYSYFLNIVGDIHYRLPGVFAHNPIPFIVNGQLWTVPVELQCYLALGALAAIGVLRNRRLLLVVVVIGQALWAWQALKGGTTENVGANGPVLTLCFLTGILFAAYKDQIVYSRNLFILSVGVCVLLLSIPRGIYCVVVPASYVTVYLGLLNPPKLKYLFSGDYSYGLYLYGYPVQQAFASLGPWTHHWYLNALVCVPTSFLVAFLSWHIVEKRCLALRRFLPRVEQNLLAMVGNPSLSSSLAGSYAAEAERAT